MCLIMIVLLWIGIGGVSGILCHLLLGRDLSMGLLQCIGLALAGAIAGGVLGGVMDSAHLQEFLEDPLRVGTVVLPIAGALVTMVLVGIATGETE